MLELPEELKELSMREESKSSIIISKIVMMDEMFENVEFSGNEKNFIRLINDGEVIKIKEGQKEIYINSNYIMSFEF